MAAGRGLRSLSPILPALALLLSGFAAGRVAAPQTTRATPALVTRWTGDVTPDRVLPEYPRPQLVRPDWQNLNGFWDYAVVARTAPAPETFDGRILVPFAIQSHLSGVARLVGPGDRVWYRRWFRAPARLPRHRLLLHFGAVDWEATVYVNGRQVGEHRGGYDPFTFDITEALSEDPEQQLLVAVWDPTDKGPQPRGKQVLEPHGIWYTAVTGIWQTVWLEPVAETHVDHLAIAPEDDLSGVTVVVAVSGPSTRDLVTLTALDHETPVATATGIAGQRLTLRLPHPRSWSPSDPFLYGLRVRLASGDAVESYFGLRTIDVATDARGFRRLFLNHAPLFEFGLLDQGWWPDGLYTAPTDAALAFDLETTRNLGFNTIRKHVKVEPARWYYHADRLGMLVWQDMPSGDNDTADARAGFARELERVVDALANHPSIVMWVPFNEGWGQHDTRRYVEWLQARDPTRLVDNASGWADEGAGQVSDAHAYPGPARPLLEDDRAAVLGEFGGLGLPLEGHTWIDRGNWGYRSYESPAALGRAYRDLLYQLRLLTGEGLAAAIYTQTTDVEVEVNGVMTYDRAVVKLPRDVASLNAQLFAEPPLITTIVPASDVTPQTWRYTFASPGSRWYDPAFADGAWKAGRGGFGKSDTPRAKVGTIWETPDIWLRRTFELDTPALRHPFLRIYHDEDAEVYLNGRLIASLSGYTGGYSFVPLDAESASALQSGQNTIAIHVHQTRGGQFIDAGLVDVGE